MGKRRDFHDNGFSFFYYRSNVTDDIKELARALQYDPELIYDYVLNHIDYVPYFGSLKGANLTYPERAGNDFDQASLMITLLEESRTYNPAIGTVQYVYGQMSIPNFLASDDYDLEHWLSVSASTSVISSVLGSGGIPANVYSSYTTMDRVWVRAAINGTDYMLDPAFKKYEVTSGIDLVSAMGYDRGSLLAAAGGEEGTDYIRNLNDGSLRSTLDNYSANLITLLRASYPNAAIEEIIGGRKIIQEPVDQLPASMRFSYSNEIYWDSIPNEYVHTVRIQHGRIDETFSIRDIAGKRLAITYVTGGAGASALKTSASGPYNVTAESLYPHNTDTWGLTGFVAEDPDLSGSYGINVQTYLNQPTDLAARLKNNGSQTLTINSISLTGANPDRFQILSGGGAGNVSPGGYRDITVRYLASSRGTHTANLHITYTYDGISGHQINLSLQGETVLEPDFTGSYGINFGQRYINDPVDRTAALKNNGTLNLTVNSINLTGTDQNLFQILNGGSSGTLSPGEVRDIEVRYLTDVTGAHNAAIQVNYTYDGLSGMVDLPLSGDTVSAASAQLWLEDTLIAEETPPVSGPGLSTMTLTIDHPYSADGGDFADQTAIYNNLKRGANYVIISDFGDSKDGQLLKQRQRLLDDYRKGGLADSSREVLTETLNVVGQTWMKQTTLSDNLLEQLSDVIAVYYFILDGNGNRTEVLKSEPLSPVLNTETVDYTYNAEKNRLVTANATSFSYDNEGQLSAKDSTSYTFDYEHRLTGIGSTEQVLL